MKYGIFLLKPYSYLSYLSIINRTKSDINLTTFTIYQIFIHFNLLSTISTKFNKQTYHTLTHRNPSPHISTQLSSTATQFDLT